MSVYEECVIFMTKKKWAIFIIIELIVDIISASIFCNSFIKFTGNEMTNKTFVLISGCIQIFQMIKSGFLTYKTESAMWQLIISSIILEVTSVYFVLSGFIGVDFKTDIIGLISDGEAFNQTIFAVTLTLVAMSPIAAFSGFLSGMIGSIVLRIKEKTNHQ